MPTHHQILGCLLGGAVGDALGAPTEFRSLDEIRRRWGPDGVTGFEPVYGRVGAVTDDTQMTLFTVEGLLRAHSRGVDRGIVNIPAAVNRAYLRWLSTQGYEPRPDVDLGDVRDGWLLEQPEVHHVRAPGNTCLSALQAGGGGTPQQPRNDSKGCGGVMRVAPVGLLPVDDHFELGCELAALTHGHPSGYLSAGAFAELIARVARGEPFPDAVRAVTARHGARPGFDEVASALSKALDIAESGPGTPELLELNGGGWVGEEALAIAVYCVAATSTPREALLLAVNHSGDTDSTGALVGQLLGAAGGVGMLPAEWVEAVECRELIEQLAADFGAVFVDNGPPDFERYPPW